MRKLPTVREFEEKFAEYQQAAAARAFWMGRVGLYGVLRALDVGPGDAVGICACTCLAVVEAVMRTGAHPVFLDVDRHLNIAPAALDALPAAPKALVLQYTFGVPAQLDACLAWAAQRQIPVIEDCCHALDATWNGQKVGSFGVGAIFGFEWGKPFSAGQGGLATFNEPGLVREVDRLIAAEAVRPSACEAAALAGQRQIYRWLVRPRTRGTLRSIYRWAGRRGWITASQTRIEQLVGPADGFFKLMASSQARVALEQLRRWPDNRDRRMAAAAGIHARLEAAGVPVIQPDPRAAPMYLRVPIWVDKKAALLAEAEAAALDIAGWYLSPAHPLQGPVLAELGYRPVCCPVAEEAFARVVTLPTRPALPPAQLARAVHLIQGALADGAQELHAGKG